MIGNAVNKYCTSLHFPSIFALHVRYCQSVIISCIRSSHNYYKIAELLFNFEYIIFMMKIVNFFFFLIEY